MLRTSLRRAGIAVAISSTLTSLAVGLAPASAYAVAGGSPAAQDQYLFAAKVEIGDVRSCSGALIDPSWIITASSCFVGADGKPAEKGAPAVPTTVTVGRPNLTGDGGAMVNVSQLVPHPGRNVMLAKLASPVVNVPRVQLAVTPPVEDETLRVAGYGRTKTEWAPNQLHTATFAVQTVAADTIAVSGRDPADATTCKGDSGGPALREKDGRTELVALNSTSWQNGCYGSTETRTGTTEVRVDDLSTWIHQQLLDAQPAPANAAGALLRVASSDKCLNVPYGRHDMVALVQWACVGAPTTLNEQWSAQSMGDGTYQIVSTNSTTTKMCLNVPNGSTADLVAIVQFACQPNSTNDRWRFQAVPGTNRFKLVAVHSNKCLQVKGGKKDDGAEIIQFACQSGTSLNEQWYAPPATATKPTVALTEFAPISVLTTGSQPGGATFAYTENSGRLMLGHRQNLAEGGSFGWTTSGAEQFAGQPVLNTNPGGYVQVTAHNIDGDIWLRSKTAATDGQSWNGLVDGGGASPNHHTAVRLRNGSIVSFNIGADGALWYSVQPDGYVTLAAWRRLGGADLVGTPTAVARLDGSAQVFVLNKDGAVQTANYANGVLSTWTSLGGSGFNGRLAVVQKPVDVSNTSRMYVFARAADGRIMLKAGADAAAFPAQWTPLGTFAAGGSPSAAVVSRRTPGSSIIVAARDTDGFVHTVRESDWSSWGAALSTVKAKSDPTVFTYFTGTSALSENADIVYRVDEFDSYYLRATGDGYVEETLPTAPR